MLVTQSRFREIAKYITFMKMAEQISKLSPDPKHQVGAILVKKDFSNIISVGYNGSNPGLPNERESLETGKSGFRHAEENCLLKANVYDPKDYMMFTTISPCRDCAGRIAIKGIDTVIYKSEYSKDGLVMLDRCKINRIDIFTLLKIKLSEHIYFEFHHINNKEILIRKFCKHSSEFGLLFTEDDYEKTEISKVALEKDISYNFLKQVYLNDLINFLYNKI